MSLHQKRVTITAVDLSKASTESYAIVITYEDEEPSESDIARIRQQFDQIVSVPLICLKKGQTLTVEQLPKQPRQRRKRRHENDSM